MENSVFRYQEGGMSPMGLDPRMLSGIMSQQGAGQGIDYNGQPTPNVSGEPSFADMAQEIQDRYDQLINPLQKRLAKLQKKLEENPSDQTIKNEIKRIEEQIDSLEQREDMELQKLEAEVQRAGNEIEQQKQMEGYGDVEMPQESQGMPDMGSEEMEIPMMQKGGFLKKIWDAIEDKPAGGYRTFKENFESAIQDMKHAEEAGGVPGAIFKYSDLNPLIGLPKAAMNFAAEQKGLKNDGEWQGNLTRALTVPTLGYLSGLSIPEAVASMGNAALGYYGGNAVANAYMANETGADYDRGMSGMLQDKLGIDKNYADLAVNFVVPMLFGGAALSPDKSNLYANFPMARVLRRPTKAGNTAGNTAAASAPTQNTTTATKKPYSEMTNDEINAELKRIIKDTPHNFASWLKKAGKNTGRIMGNTLASPFIALGRPGANIVSAFSGKTYNYPAAAGKGYYTPGEWLRSPVSTSPNWIYRTGQILGNAGKYGLLAGAGIGLNHLVDSHYDTDKQIEAEKEKEEGAEIMEAVQNKMSRQYGGIVKHRNEPKVENNNTDEKTKKEKWADDFIKNWQKLNPTGIKGYFKDTPATEYVEWGNALGKLFDTSGRTNIDAQNQFRYSNNPYTSVYDRANRQYQEQLADTNRRYDIANTELRRLQPKTEYGSMQQNFNAKLAQDMIMRQQLAKNENDRQTALNAVESSFGKTANDAYASMMEQDYKNDLYNENQRKAYLQALDTYNKEKQAQFDQLVNMAAIAGNRRKDIDMMNTVLFPNIINAAINDVDLRTLLPMFGQMYSTKQQHK